MTTIFNKVFRYLKSIGRDDTEINNNDQDMTDKSHQVNIINCEKHTPYTPYRDALLRNLNPTSIPPGIHHYNKLGNKINEIVDENIDQRPYAKWWKDEFVVQNEYYIIEN